MLNIISVDKSFNVGTVNESHVLKKLNLNVDDGEFVTVIGSNGAGKSTLFNVITGAYPPDNGRILLDGMDISDCDECKRAKYIGRVFQDPMLGTAANLHVEENLSLAYRRTKRRGLRPYITAEERVLYKKLLARLDLGLEDRLSARVGLLSGGQRQAVSLLMATLQKPKLLLLDEHTAALDPKTAAKVSALTNEIVTESHITTIMITHNMSDAIKFGNRLIMLHEGRIVYEASGDEKRKLCPADLLEKFRMLDSTVEQL